MQSKLHLRFSFVAIFSLILATGLALSLAPTPALAAGICVDPANPGSCYATIQAAINAAHAGDTITVAQGTYLEVLSLVGKDNLTISGAGEGLTTIDAHLSGSYGWNLSANGITLDHFTLIGPNGATGYGLKVAGINSTTRATNFAIHNVTIQNSFRTGLDINGVNGVTITDVTVTGSVNGNGISITDVSNATLTNIITSGNAWGSIGIMTLGHYYPGGSDNVTLTNITHAEVIYSELGNFTTPSSPYQLTNFSAPQLGFKVVNATDQPNKAFFVETLDEANALAGNAVLFPPPAASVIVDRSAGSVTVTSGTSIQAAIDAADPGDTVHVNAGSYAEQLTISKNLHLVGAGVGASFIQAPGSLPNGDQQTSAIIIIQGSGVDVELTGFTVTGPGSAPGGSIGTGIFVRDGAHANIHDNSILDIHDLVFSGAQHGIAILVGRKMWSTSGTASIDHNTISGYQKGGIVVDNTGSDATISNNIVTGVGTTSINAQNGIQVSRGATATLTGNIVSGNSYHLGSDPSSEWGATGILFYGAGPVTLAGGNVVTGNDQNLYKYNGSGLLTLGAETFGSSTAPAGTGFDITNEDSQPIDAAHVTFTGAADGFAIEDRISDGLDGDRVGAGLVNWNTTGVIYVTSTSGSIQRGINAAASGGTVEVAPGTYRENLIIPQPLTLAGADRATTIIEPAVSSPNCGGTGVSSLCPGASSVILVQASNVTIHDLTVDGDNTNLTSGITAGGADLDARNGIITNHTTGVYDSLEVYNTTVQNIYLRGMYASSGGTFNFHNNTVTNVQADPASIAIFVWGATGQVENNTVSFANDAIAANHSKGVQFLNNIVTDSASGIHTDNAGDAGGAADLIQGNSISNCTTNGYGVFVFVPYIAPTFDHNTITNCTIGLSAWGQGAAVTTEFTNNTVNGPAKAAGSVGAYISTDRISYGYSDSSVNFSGNTITGNETGVMLDAGVQTTDPTFVSRTVNAVFHTNQIYGNTTGADKSATGTIVNDLAHNWWGAVTGPNSPDNTYGTGDAITSGINAAPWCAQAGCTSFLPPFGTSTTITSDAPDSSTVGQDVTINFSVAGLTTGGPTPAGLVDVSDGATVICNDVALDGSGDGTCTYAFPAGGDFTLTATFNPTDTGLFSTSSDAEAHVVSTANHAPVITEGDTVSVNMSTGGSPNPFDLTLHATDADATDILTWSIATPAGHGTATASGTGLSAVIAYVPTAAFSGSDSFDVQVSDGTDTATITVNVSITAVNNPPTNISLSQTAVDENKPAGTTVGTLSSTDPDAGDTNFTYSLVSVSGCPGTDNASFQITGSTLQTHAAFDYETKNSYAICIRTDDGHAGLYQKPFTITVNNLVENSTMTFVSNGAQDGWVLESSQTSSLGGTKDNTSQTLRVGDDAQNRQYRSILSFNTKNLPDNAVIVSATLKLKRTTSVGTNPFTTHRMLLVNIAKPYFGSLPSLQINDFEAAGLQASTLRTTPVGGFYLATLNRLSLAKINLVGLTQLRLRFQLGDNNDNNADYLSFFSGNAATASFRPVLVIVYHLP